MASRWMIGWGQTPKRAGVWRAERQAKIGS
jgi:hypothetical protein